MSARRRGAVTWMALGAAVLLLPYVFAGNFALGLFAQIGIAIVFALSYNMLLGETGLLSFGHALYAGLGGYAAAHLLNASVAHGWGLPVAFLPLAGGVAGALAGSGFGFLSTRRAGTTFAMITLGLGEMVAASALMFPDWFGGEAGISLDRTAGAAWLGITFGPLRQLYYLVAVWCIAATAAMFAWRHTPLARLANAVRDNPERASFVGYDPRRVRYQVMILAGFFAGMSGALLALDFEIVTAENVGMMRSAGVLLATIIGGAEVFWGPIAGAIVYVCFVLVLPGMTRAWLFYLGLFFVLVVMFVPGGVAGAIAAHGRWWRASLRPPEGHDGGGGRVRHGGGWGARLGPPLRAWCAALGAAAVLLAALILSVELVYRLQLGGTSGAPGISGTSGPLGSSPTLLSLAAVGLPVTLDAAKPLSWLIATACWLAGAGGALAARRWVRAASARGGVR